MYFKQNLCLFFVFLASGLMSQDLKTDNYGKLIGQIIDAETGWPVNEEFRIIVGWLGRGTTWISVDTDKKGRFSTFLEPGNYYVLFEPKESDTIYCKTPDPETPADFEFIEIIKGKISRITRKAIHGGSLKVTINNVEDLVKEGGRIYVGWRSKECRIYKSYEVKANNNTIKGIFPCIYTVKIEFSNLGYPDQIKENVNVSKDEMTEIGFQIDVSDITGIEGQLFDKNGIPVVRAHISFLPDAKIKSYDIETRASGYFVLKGMNEGLYKILVGYNFKDFDLGSVFIKKNILLKKNLTINWAK